MAKLISYFSFMSSVVLLSLVSTEVFAQVGFSSGADFTARAIYGQASVQCSEGSQTSFQTFQCQDFILLPASADFFFGPKIFDANLVNLQAIRQDGTVRNKTVDYDGASGRSKFKINLWAQASFQSPLLAEGVNQLDFSVFKLGSVVAKGQFIVKVKRAEPGYCPNGSFYSSNMADCENPYTICQRLFNQFNYCQ